MSDQLTRILGEIDTGLEITHGSETPQMHVMAVHAAVTRLIWGTMYYECDACGFGCSIGMSLGVEGPKEMRERGLYLASPFSAGSCPAWPHMKTCDGYLSHKGRGRDEEFATPRIAPDNMPRFVLPDSVWRSDQGARLEVPEPALIEARQFHNIAATPTPEGEGR